MDITLVAQKWKLCKPIRGNTQDVVLYRGERVHILNASLHKINKIILEKVVEIQQNEEKA